MKQIATSLVFAVLISNSVMASTIADGFNWPYGLSSADEIKTSEMISAVDGLNWPYGLSSIDETQTSEITSVAYGLNWPEGL